MNIFIKNMLTIESKQMKTGKAFEYALLFKKELKRELINQVI